MVTRKMSMLWILPVLVLLGSCVVKVDPPEEARTAEEQALTPLQTALHEGDFVKTDKAITELEKNADVSACSLAWGRALSGVLATLDRINGYLNLFPGGSAPAFEPGAINGNALLRDLVAPFEKKWLRIRDNARLAVKDGCTFTVPGGVPFVIGNEGATIYAKIVLGDDWTTPVARILLSSFTSLQAVIDFVLSHNLNVVDEITKEAWPAFSDLNKKLKKEEENSRNTTQPVEHSWVPLARSTGAVFDVAPDFIGFAKAAEDRLRFEGIPAELHEIFATIYSSGSGGEEGIIPDLLAAGRNEEAAGRSVLGYIDADGSQSVSTGDKVVLGLREFEGASVIEIPSMEKGIVFTIPKSVGKVGQIVDAFHKMIKILGNQAASVDDPNVSTRRLSLAPVNDMILANSTSAENLGALPEAIEINIAAYFGNKNDPARPLRDYLPYWYDDDNSAETLDVFMIEGESVKPFDDQYVYARDITHFEDSFAFGTIVDIPPATIVGEQILPDLVTPPIEAKIPFPYVAWQDPSIHKVIWTDPSKLPDVGNLYTPGFAPADQASVNLLLNWYLRYFFEAANNSLLSLP